MANVLKKTIIDERTGWEYELKCDQYCPAGRTMRNGALTPENIVDEPEEYRPIGIWGQRHLNYIRQHKKSLYLDLLLSGKLNAYLTDINAQAEDMFFRLIKEMSARDEITEALKTKDQMLWVEWSNNIYNRAQEIVNNEIIY